MTKKERIKLAIWNAPQGITVAEMWDKFKEEGDEMEYATISTACTMLRRSGRIVVLKEGKPGVYGTVYGKPDA